MRGRVLTVNLYSVDNMNSLVDFRAAVGRFFAADLFAVFFGSI